MVLLRNITYSILFLMLFSPLISYLTLGILELRSSTFYFKIVFIAYGIIFLFTKKNIKLPKPLFLLIPYIIYLFIWAFYNGEIDRRGIIPVLLNNDNISIFFATVIIYNTHFTDRFIKKSLTVIKITIIIAVITSIYQVLNYNFLNATSAWAKLMSVDPEISVETNIYQIRRTSIFGFVNRNELGLSFMPILSTSIAFFIKNKNKSWIFFITLGGIIALLSNTRYIMLAYVLIVFQVLIIQKFKINKLVKYSILIIISGFLILKTLNFFGYDFIDWYNTRLFPEGSIKATTRFKAIENFLYFFPNNKFFGTGGVTQEIVSASHSVGSSQIHVGYLSHLVYYGIIGSIFLFGFWFLLAKKLLNTARKTNFWGAFFAILIFLWSNATLVHFSLFFYGILFSLIFDKYYTDSEKFTQSINHRGNF